MKWPSRIVNIHGFVEFRPTLTMIVDRLEAKSFEIAVFGRVSSGKSLLLNRHIAHRRESDHKRAHPARIRERATIDGVVRGQEPGNFGY